MAKKPAEAIEILDDAPVVETVEEEEDPGGLKAAIPPDFLGPAFAVALAVTLAVALAVTFGTALTDSSSTSF